ncbi:MAG: hypothetical protein JSS81_29175 [Acidobacteria bacterium]|nr:hypothetical protein [Acidobacteriota bacterium]
MAINMNVIRRPADRNLYIAAAVTFPLLVLIGYFKSFYFRPFFEAFPLANGLVYMHGAIMTLWVLFFTLQIALVRTKNLKLHISLGTAGIALAIVLVVIGAWTAYDAHVVRQVAPPGMSPYTFLIVPIMDLVLFIVFFGGAIYYRKQPLTHKSLMLLTALNFLAAPLGRIPFIPPQFMILWAFGVPDVLAVGALVWTSIRHRKINWIFAAGTLLLVASHPFRVWLGFSDGWIDLMKRLFG